MHVTALPLRRPIDWHRLAIGLWSLLAMIIVASVLRGPRHTVSAEYFEAGRHWVAGEDLYLGTGWGFLYLPQAAILMTPLSVLPPLAAEVLWRLISIGALAWGVRRLAALATPEGQTDWFPLLSIIMVPLAFSSARNGQMNLLLTAALLAATIAVAHQQWWRATCWLMLGLALKPLALVMLLLAGAMYRPLLGRLLVGVCVLLLVPFCLQSWDYVARQYSLAMATFGQANQFTDHTYWAEVFGMLKNAGVVAPHSVQVLCRLAAALLTLALCLTIARRDPLRSSALGLFTFATAYVVLLNPRSENCGYVLLAPAVALWFAEGWSERGRRSQAVAIALLSLGILGSYEIGKLFVPAPQASWLAPLMGCCFVAMVVRRVSRGPLFAEAVTPRGVAAPPAMPRSRAA